MSELRSTLLGLIDPSAPREPEGFGGGIVAAEPVLIRAPASIVWAVVAGFESYPAWNPFNRFFVCEGRVGTRARFGVSWGPFDGNLRDATMTVCETVTVWEPGRCLAYADDRGWLHRAERIQLITETPDGTRYQTYERWTGWMTPLVSALYARRIRTGFRAASEAVKARAESLAAGA